MESSDTESDISAVSVVSEVSNASRRKGSLLNSKYKYYNSTKIIN